MLPLPLFVARELIWVRANYYLGWVTLSLYQFVICLTAGLHTIFCTNNKGGDNVEAGMTQVSGKKELRCHQLKEFMKLQPFSWLCFAGVQLMQSVEFLLFYHVSIVSHPSLHNVWCTPVLIPLGFSYHSCFPRCDTGSSEFCEDVAVTAAYIPGRTVESGGQRENCNQRDVTFHPWDLRQAVLA